MAEDAATIRKAKVEEKISALAAVDHRRIFISHAHGDKNLSDALAALIAITYSGIVESFASSQAAPQRGLQPGQQWFPAIHEELRIADAVWVLATPYSLKHPWVYWEAGIGSVLSSVVVVRVGVSDRDLASPLNQFQTFDGLVKGDGGMGELIAKAGAQFGMDIPAVLLGAPVDQWVATATAHEPALTGGEEAENLTPERVERIEQLIGRLEGGVLRLEGAAPASPQVGFSRLSRAARPPLPRHVTRGERAARQAAMEARPPSDPFDAEGTEVFGGVYAFIRSKENFLAMLAKVPEDTVVSTNGFDRDGDLVLVGRRGERMSYEYLRGPWLDTSDAFAPADVLPRFKELMLELAAAIVPDGDA